MSKVSHLLQRVRADADLSVLDKGLIGLEKESLRVAKQGGMAMTPHPASLGSPLTHPWITTDYSEALMEFITPPFEDFRQSLEFLSDLQTFVYEHLSDELLWATSMPCVLRGEQSIPIARYGASNAGRMKHVYRVGLGHRYGRVMQVIAGVHFNYSVAEDFWPMYRQLIAPDAELREFRDSQYMGMIRNLQRFGWLIPYLFGASPAVCKSFFVGKSTRLETFDETTYYEPYATSLRLGDIGYQNRREEGAGVKACYDNLDAYVESLKHAIETSSPLWEELGVKVDGEYRQLNSNILQIENEYYSSIRPKQLLNGLEKPVNALRHRGIRYVELRSLDVNAYQPLGVDETQIRFIEALMLFSLLNDSPRIDLQERWEIDRNLEKVAHRGRDPDLRLIRGGQGVSVRDWGEELLDRIWPVCEALDEAQADRAHAAALKAQIAKVRDPGLTPSAVMLEEMRDRGEGFYEIANRLSTAHARYFRGRQLTAAKRESLENEVGRSLERQRRIEAEDQRDFDRFLAEYFAQ